MRVYLKGIIRGLGLGIRDFEGLAWIMGNWPKSLCGLASEDMDTGVGHIGTEEKFKLGD